MKTIAQQLTPRENRRTKQYASIECSKDENDHNENGNNLSNNNSIAVGALPSSHSSKLACKSSTTSTRLYQKQKEARAKQSKRTPQSTNVSGHPTCSITQTTRQSKTSQSSQPMAERGRKISVTPLKNDKANNSSSDSSFLTPTSDADHNDNSHSPIIAWTTNDAGVTIDDDDAAALDDEAVALGEDPVALKAECTGDNEGNSLDNNNNESNTSFDLRDEDTLEEDPKRDYVTNLEPNFRYLWKKARYKKELGELLAKK